MDELEVSFFSNLEVAILIASFSQLPKLYFLFIIFNSCLVSKYNPIGKSLFLNITLSSIS